MYLLWLCLNKARLPKGGHTGQSWPTKWLSWPARCFHSQMFYKNITIAVYGVLFNLIFPFKLLEFKL